ncbi:MAG: signal peptide peptidase SppA [Methanoregula sp.]|nr:signal peptide peptidase SppA [Methanoregula sp.]
MAQTPDNSPAYAAPGSAPQNTGLKWFLLITFGLVLVIGIVIAAFFITDNSHPGVRVIRMEGELSTGDFTDDTSVGSEYVGNQLRDAADDPMVEAIVLRVNSPGGSPAAAEEIISDMEYAKTKKPVVVSMGDMATSAAYYVSSHADRIYADSDTFTGGIGVIWTFSDISGWMKDEGYNVTVVKSGEKKDMGSTSRSLTTSERDYAQQIVNESFEEFITDVMHQRAISRSSIDDGRVFRGADAIKINLVDTLGNLNDAIEGARELADSRK